LLHFVAAYAVVLMKLLTLLLVLLLLPVLFVATVYFTVIAEASVDVFIIYCFIVPAALAIGLFAIVFYLFLMLLLLLLRQIFSVIDAVVFLKLIFFSCCLFCTVILLLAQAFKNMLIVPPGSGIVHQVNLEYLARVCFQEDGTYR
jgi:hypothetical protein